MKDPVKYYDNNVFGTLCLLEAMNAANVRRIVFSSTAATYGEPEKVPIEESDRTEPTNVYGETKLMMERMMSWFDKVQDIKYVSCVTSMQPVHMTAAKLVKITNQRVT